MNLYSSLTLRYLKENKKRTIVTIIGIILSTALICGIGNIFESLMDWQIRKTVEVEGRFYATFDDMNKEEASIISKSAGVKEYGYSKDLGVSKLENKKDNLVEVKAYDKAMFDYYNLTLKEGRLPKNDREIVFSDIFLSLSDKKVGDTITLNIGKRVTGEGEDLRGSWVSEDEKIIDSESKEFKIVGMINKPGFEVGKQVINGITYLDINNLPTNSTVDVSILTNSPKNIYEVAEVILKNLGLKVADEVTKDNIDDSESYNYNNDQGIYYEKLTFNEHLLRLQGASAYSNIGKTMTTIIILVTSLVIICTIATVYNSFSISIGERKKQFGILNSIGATKHQTMKLVFVEALIVSIIGIPIGLISGTLAIDIVFKVIQNLFTSSSIANMNLRVVYSPYVIILSAIIVLITIIISSIAPAITASRVSPLDAIKNSDNFKVGKIKDSKIVRALFKAEGVLAYKNLRRNKKKFRITLFSLIISVVIFISFSGFMTLFIKAQNVHLGQMNYDLYISRTAGVSEGKDIVNELNNIEGIERIAALNEYNITANLDEDKVNKEYEDIIKNYHSKEKEGNKDVYKIINSMIKLPGDMEISKIKLKKGEFNKENAIKENGVILVDKSYYEEPGKKGEVNLTNYKVGDIVKASTTLYDEDGNNETEINVSFKILAITDDVTIGNSSYNYMGLDFITYDEVGENLGFIATKDTLYVASDKKEETRKAVKELCDKEGYYFSDQTAEAKEMEDTLNVMNIFVYGFITVISLVSVTNIVNTISTNINLRKREFAIIKSIGVTPGGFNKIIYLESLLYGILSLLYGIPLGIGLVALMNVILGDVIQFGLVLPWDAIIICIIGIFLITFISAYIPMKKINKENIIENIRQESI